MEHQLTLERRALIRKEAHQWLHDKLYALDNAGKTPQIPFDTLIDSLSEGQHISRRDAMTILLDIVGAVDVFFCDRTVIGLRYSTLKCQCGAKYSSRLGKCPDKIHEAKP